MLHINIVTFNVVYRFMALYGNYVVIPDWNGSHTETFCSHLGNTLTDMLVTAKLSNDYVCNIILV